MITKTADLTVDGIAYKVPIPEDMTVEQAVSALFFAGSSYGLDEQEVSEWAQALADRFFTP